MSEHDEKYDRLTALAVLSGEEAVRALRKHADDLDSVKAELQPETREQMGVVQGKLRLWAKDLDHALERPRSYYERHRDYAHESAVLEQRATTMLLEAAKLRAKAGSEYGSDDIVMNVATALGVIVEFPEASE